MAYRNCPPPAQNNTAAKPSAASRTSPAADLPGRQDLPDNQLLKLGEVVQRVRMSKAWIYKEMKAGEFPQRRLIGRGSARWLAKEIDAWIESRPRGGGAGYRPPPAPQSKPAARIRRRGASSSRSPEGVGSNRGDPA